jgi:4-amino-4-deoxy-L-arabinose transferase-like glycosyltransferase
VAGTVAVALVTGIAMRAWILAADVSPTESDEAVLGLIALRLSRGDLHLMYWGQAYGGPVESFLVAPFFWLFGPSVLLTKVAASCLAFASAVLIWRIGRRTVGNTAGLLAGSAFWIWPAYFVFYSTKMSIYFGSLLLALAVVLLLLQLRDDDTRRWWAPAAGTIAGLAFWASPQTLFLLLPVTIALLPSLLRRWRSLLMTVPFAVLGAAPWFAFNAGNDWISLERPPVDAEVPYLQRVLDVAPQVPIALGLRRFGTERWISRELAAAVLALFAIGLVVAILRRSRRWGALWVAVLLFPFAYAVSPLSVYTPGGSPRYFLTAIPLVALLVGRGLTWAGSRLHHGVAALGMLLVLGISLLGLEDLARHRLGWFRGAPDAVVPPDFDDLRSLLRDHGVRHAYADYWVSFRATFETGERTIVAPVQPYLDRYPPYSAEVAAAPAPAFVTLTESQVTEHVARRLTSLGIAFTRQQRGDFVLLLPDSPVSRDSVWTAYQLQE